MNEAVIDSNVLVAIIDSRDKWHRQAKELVAEKPQSTGTGNRTAK